MPIKKLIHRRHLNHLEKLRQLLPSWDDVGLKLGEEYTMYWAEIDLMKRHAALLTEGKIKPNVLEIGGGLGVFGSALLDCNVGSYTILEVNAPVAANLDERRNSGLLPQSACVVRSAWQSYKFEEDVYDAIMYDTWPPKGIADRDFTAFLDFFGLRALRNDGRFSFFCSGLISPYRLGVLMSRFKSIHIEAFTVHNTPASWNKKSNCCSICVATYPKR